MFGKFGKELNAEIKETLTTDLPRKIKKGIEYDAYMNTCREPLNMIIISYLTGSNIKEKDGTKVLRFNHSLPKESDVKEIAAALDKFIEDHEESYLIDNNIDDDMEISGLGLGDVRKPKEASEKLMIGSYALSKFMDSDDVMEIYKVAKKIRKRLMIRNGIIAGSILLVAAGAGTAAYLILRDKSSDSDEIDTTDDDVIDIDNSVEVADIDDIQVEDVPMVTIDD